ncbi:hypothetical protein F5146DRAFT_1001565 [Armillaria mellea]|nr:hypothetical protein F5146DRAFT_1001565 [Armillaria mellea]
MSFRIAITIVLICESLGVTLRQYVSRLKYIAIFSPPPSFLHLRLRPGSNILTLAVVALVVLRLYSLVDQRHRSYFTLRLEGKIEIINASRRRYCSRPTRTRPFFAVYKAADNIALLLLAEKRDNARLLSISTVGLGAKSLITIDIIKIPLGLSDRSYHVLKIPYVTAIFEQSI